MSEEDYSEVQMGSINHDNLEEYVEQPSPDTAKKGHDWFKHIHNDKSHMQSCSFKLEDQVYDDGQMPNEIEADLAQTLKNETSGAARLRKMLLSGNCGQQDLAAYTGVRNTAQFQQANQTIEDVINSKTTLPRAAVMSPLSDTQNFEIERNQSLDMMELGSSQFHNTKDNRTLEDTRGIITFSPTNRFKTKKTVQFDETTLSPSQGKRPLQQVSPVHNLGSSQDSRLMLAESTLQEVIKMQAGKGDYVIEPPEPPQPRPPINYDSKGDFDVRWRANLSRVFKSWLDVQKEEKLKWENLVRFRYILKRLKMRRLLNGFKIQVKLNKIERLRTTIISHQLFKRTRSLCFEAWKKDTEVSKLIKQGLVNIEEILVENRARKFLLELRNSQQQDDFLAAKFTELTNSRKRQMKSKALWALRAYVRKRNIRDELNRKATVLRRKLLLWINFKALSKFADMKVLKLAGIKVVNDHLIDKRRERVLRSLMLNKDEQTTKENNLRIACQFRLFRAPLIVKRLVFDEIKDGPKNREIVGQFKRRRAFQAWKKIVFRCAMSAAGNETRLKLRLYQSCLDEQLSLDQDYQLSPTIQDISRRHSMNQSVTLLGSIRTQVGISQEQSRISNFYRDQTPLEKSVNSRLSRIMDQFENLPQIESLKGRQFVDSLARIVHRKQRLAFEKVRLMTDLFSVEQKSSEHYNKALVSKSFQAFKVYLKRRQKSWVSGTLARKFRYLHQLSSGFKPFVNYKRKCDERRAQKGEIELKYKHLLIGKVFSQFKMLESLSRVKQQRVTRHLQRKESLLARKIIAYWADYTEKQIRYNRMSAMAVIKYDNRLKMKVFEKFIETLSTDILLKRRLEFIEKKAIAEYQKRIKRQVFIKLVRNLRQKTRYHAKLAQIEAIVRKDNLSNALKHWKLRFVAKQISRENKSIADQAFRFKMVQKSMMAFKQNRNKSVLQYDMEVEAVEHYRLNLLKTAVYRLRCYVEHRAVSRLQYENAAILREREQKKHVIFKIMKVGAYWRTRGQQNLVKPLGLTGKLQGQSWFDQQLQSYFLTWKNKLAIKTEGIKKPSQMFGSQMSFGNVNASSQKLLQTPSIKIRQGSPHSNTRNTGLMPRKNEEVLDWLYSFDKKKPQHSQSDLNSNLSESRTESSPKPLKKEGKKSLKQFDDFLQTLKPQGQPESVKSSSKPEALSSRKPSFASIHSSQQPSIVDENFWAPPQVNSSASLKSESQENTRSNFLKREIKQFLDDKKLLLQLEGNTVDRSMRSGASNTSTAVVLLRDDIKRKSGLIEAYCMELKQLKNKQI